MSDKPIPRRLRFEILKRDRHACRYCGATAPDAILTVDHVIPRALGGSDDPTNLVTACRDCNYGKASVHPGDETVADVAADALRWARAMELAAERERAVRAEVDANARWFRDVWSDWTYVGSNEGPPLDANWDESIARFIALGLSRDDLQRFIWKAMEKRGLRSGSEWRYFCGICWNTLTDRQEAARRILEDGEA